MPASQHQSPKSDIEISQAAKKRLILDVARERLGIAPENLEPYGHYKAKVSMNFVKSLQDKPNGKLILVSAITASPMRSIISAKRPCSACASHRSVRHSA
jgi:formate--tetrahydrofolate ligase